jgi:hypothetical protein
VSISNSSSLLSFSRCAHFAPVGRSVENGSAISAGDQLNKWIELNLSGLAITGFTFQAHRQTSGAGSVIMSSIISPWRGVADHLLWIAAVSGQRG